MKEISYFDFYAEEGVDSYINKSISNVGLFNEILTDRSAVVSQMLSFPEDRNKELLLKIKKITGLTESVIKEINVADEVMNLNAINLFGCTSVSKDGKIGQTLDLFTLDLCVVREPDALYVTMPPYLAIMGMGRKVAFVTNFISGPVRANGIPISHMRRELMRRDSVRDAIAYLESIDRSNTVNFLISDGEKVVNVECKPDRIVIDEPKNSVIAHTNHFVAPNIHDDTQCPRLTKANKLLSTTDYDIRAILDDASINLPIHPITENYGFGSIVHLVMDVKEKIFKYRDPFMKDYKELKLEV